MKHWGRDPKEIPASYIRRLPVRLDYNDSYYRCLYQGVPKDGYTEIIQRILDHQSITLSLGCLFHTAMREEFDHVFYTGALDKLYDYSYGMLSYRTVFWERSVSQGTEIGHAAMNYPCVNVPYTRKREHKYYKYWKDYEKTVVFTEYSKDTTKFDIPFYPIRLRADLIKYAMYIKKGMHDSGISFLGRLALYKYLDMHEVILDALELADQILYSLANDTKHKLPKFPPRRDAEIRYLTSEVMP